MIPLILMPPLAVWFFATIPEAARELAMGGAIAMTLTFAFGVLLSFLIGAYAYFGLYRRSRDINLETAILMAVIAFVATASMEFVREGIRKPYLLYGIMYSNGILVEDVDRYNEEGVLKYARWIEPDTSRHAGELARGEALYRLQCLRCHQYEGYNAIVPLIRDWNEPLITSALDHLDQIKTFMPPFIGSEEEKRALGAYLLTLTRDYQRTGGRIIGPAVPSDAEVMP